MTNTAWKFLPVFILLTSFYIDATAQSFRWGGRGGSIDPAGSAQLETVIDMATDPNGNVYTLSRVYKSTVEVGGTVKQGYGGRDVQLSSFSCNGNFRWTKLIGSTQGDIAYQVKTDNNNGVYLTFAMFTSNGNSYIDTDSTVLSSTTTLWLVKYDTTGNFQWARTPHPDTISVNSAWSKSGSIDMDVDGAGNITWLCQLAPAVYGGAGGFVVNDTSDYILKYDANGNFAGGIDIEISKLGKAGIARDYTNKRIYISGQGNGTPIPVGNTAITHSKFIVCFDDNGKFVWKRENTTLSGGFYGRPVVDDDGNIYVGGDANGESLTTTPPVPADHFNGYTVQNATGSSALNPVIFKLDKDGNNLWAADADVGAVTIARGGVALRNSGEVVLPGSYPGSMEWASGITAPSTGGGYNIFLARFSTQTGKVLGVDYISQTTGHERATAIVADGRNNVYVGGEMEGTITVNGTKLDNSGGETDWFIAKFGHDNCNCTNIPEPGYSYYINANGANFTYTGSSYSSILWDFGNGDTSTKVHPVYDYPVKGVYTACVTVTNDCGDNTYCGVVTAWPNDVATINEQTGNVKIYPNPASDKLFIEGLGDETQIELLDIVGRSVYSKVTSNKKETINISTLPHGSYIIHISGNDGQITTRKLLKQ